MNRERLERLIVVLEQVEREEKPFNLQLWISHDECGTVACACGYAALDPVLSEQGLKLDVYRGFDTIKISGPEALKDPELDWNTAILTYNGDVDMYAVADFFGLSVTGAHDLFHVSGYDHPDVTPRDVINQIRQVLDAGEVSAVSATSRVKIDQWWRDSHGHRYRLFRMQSTAIAGQYMLWFTNEAGISSISPGTEVPASWTLEEETGA